MSLPVVLLNTAASFVFLIATVYALKNQALTGSRTSFWPAFAVGSGLSAVWTFAVTLEWLEVMPVAMDLVSAQVEVAAVTAFVVCAFLILRGEPDPAVQ